MSLLRIFLTRFVLFFFLSSQLRFYQSHPEKRLNCEYIDRGRDRVIFTCRLLNFFFFLFVCFDPFISSSDGIKDKGTSSRVMNHLKFFLWVERCLDESKIKRPKLDAFSRTIHHRPLTISIGNLWFMIRQISLSINSLRNGKDLEFQIIIGESYIHLCVRRLFIDSHYMIRLSNRSKLFIRPIDPIERFTCDYF